MGDWCGPHGTFMLFGGPRLHAMRSSPLGLTSPLESGLKAILQMNS